MPSFNFPKNVSSLTFLPLMPLFISLNHKPDSYFYIAARWSRLQDGYTTKRMRCEWCLTLGTVLTSFIIQLNNNSIGPTKKYSIWRFYSDKDVNQKYKFTAPNQLLLNVAGQWFEFYILFWAFLVFGKLELPTKKLHSKTQFIIVKENSVT